MSKIRTGKISKGTTSLTTSSAILQPLRPCRGEVWVVNLDPTVGSEIKKSRPVVVMSSDVIGKLPIKLVAPITGWQTTFEGRIWLVKINPSSTNGLTKTSAVDTLQARGIDVQRFTEKLGRLSEEDVDNIAAAIAAVVEYS
jgi:mRNA interferase MazF